MSKKMVKILSICLALTLVAVIAGCGGQKPSPQQAAPGAEVSFPNKAITIICPWSVDDVSDALARSLGKSMEEILKQSVVVNNITGDSGATGHGAGLHAVNDGYMVTMITFELLSLPQQNLIPFTYKDFDLLAMVNMDAAALTVSQNAPYNTLAEFIAYAKANPGAINIGNYGPGSAWHIAGGMFGKAADIQMNFVPFSSSVPAITELVNGHIQAISVSAVEVRSQVEAGTLKILGVMSDERLPNFLNVPTFKEQGVDVSFGTWRGFAVPKGTPESVKSVLVDAIQKGMENPEFQNFAQKNGFGLVFMPPDEFGAFLDAESVSIAETMKDIGITI